MFIDLLISKNWNKDPHNVLIIGNKTDRARINGCTVRDCLLKSFGCQKYRFNYVETNALLNQEVTSFCLDLAIDIFSIYKVREKLKE